jgi:DNA modification methylase
MTVEYRVGDALAVARSLPEQSVQFVHLDDAWARPKRNGGFGVEYPTHPFDEADAETVDGDPGVTTELTVVDVLEACYRALQPGGVIAIDTDSYLIAKILDYAASEWSPTGFALAQTTALSKDGTPDRSTPGMYLSSGGTTTVFAWKNASPVPEEHPLRQHHDLHCPCQRQREDYGWGTVKPLAPFLQWIDAYTNPGDRIFVPCAGTAPAAVAAERLYGDDADVLAVDIEAEAKEAYERRRADELDRQETLAEWSR